MGFLGISVNFDAIAQDSWELLGYSTSASLVAAGVHIEQWSGPRDWRWCGRGPRPNPSKLHADYYPNNHYKVNRMQISTRFLKQLFFCLSILAGFCVFSMMILWMFYEIDK